jgi:SAM-dependent methyltransferase
MSELPKLYQELASWWPILSAPEDYAEEAAFYQQALLSASHIPLHTLLELGSGGGSNASHLKKRFRMTLVDLAPGMLQVSQALNPECEHLLGDMRTVRLGREFDAVFIQDAIGYMTTLDDLRQAIATASVHCRPGGVALFAPDCTRETFRPTTGHGGHDRGDRSLRYLEWGFDPDPADSTYLFYMVYLLHEAGQDDEMRCILDKHIIGLFSQAEWMQAIEDAGFQPQTLRTEHSEVGEMQVFLGLKLQG